MQYYDITVAANGRQLVEAPGTFFYYLTGNAGGADATIKVTLGLGGTTVLLKPGQSIRLPVGAKPIDVWRVENYANTQAILGQVLIGQGDFKDTNTTGTVQVVDGGKSRTLAANSFALVLSPAGSAGNYAMGQLWNPAGSGTRLVVEAMGINSNVANTIVFWATSNAALATLVGGGVNKRLSSATVSVAQGRTGGQAAVIGDPNRLACQAILQWGWVQQKLAEPIVIDPGYGLVCQNAGAQNQVMGVQFEWYEEANT